MRSGRIVVRRFGGPEVLEWREEALAEAGPGEVRVRVLAAGVAYGDLYRRRGYVRPPLPFTPGFDVVGEVERAGEGAAAFVPGDRVGAVPVLGGYAERIVLPAERLLHLPSAPDPAALVALLVNYATALDLLRASGAERGDAVLVHAAAGGVGGALLDLARRAGLRAYGTASAAKHDAVRAFGGVPIDYRAEDFAERVRAECGGVVAVFDGVGAAAHLARSRAALREGGRLIAYGFAGARTEEEFAGGLAAVREAGAQWRQLDASGPGYRRDVEALLGMLARGEIAPRIHARLPLREARRAHEMLEGGEARGKIVLVP